MTLSPPGLDRGDRAVHGPLLLPGADLLSPAITSFEGPFAYLANDYPAPLRFEAWGDDDWEAPTLEHAFQAFKAGTLEEFRLILRCPAAQTAWEAGRKVALRGDWSDWEDIKIDTMRYLLRRKFAQDDLAVRLEETGAAALIAGNRWHDGYWGVCRCPACAGVGANVLGAVLMWVREAAR
jgi:predicted NAD-dependent protein-ADP-ribosyltransferase YbiA (DUF1768 family)